MDGHGMGRLELLGYLDGWLGEWEGFRTFCIRFYSFTYGTADSAMLYLDLNKMHSLKTNLFFFCACNKIWDRWQELMFMAGLSCRGHSCFYGFINIGTLFFSSTDVGSWYIHLYMGH